MISMSSVHISFRSLSCGLMAFAMAAAVLPLPLLAQNAPPLRAVSVEEGR